MAYPLIAGHLYDPPGPNCGISNTGDYRHASVLVPFLQLEEEWHVLFEKRADGIRQGGEVSFPGGGVEVNDDDSRGAAVRETVEELGIEAVKIDVPGLFGRFIGPHRIGPIMQDRLEVLQKPPDCMAEQVVLNRPGTTGRNPLRQSLTVTTPVAWASRKRRFRPATKGGGFCFSKNADNAAIDIDKLLSCHITGHSVRSGGGSEIFRKKIKNSLAKYVTLC